MLNNYLCIINITNKKFILKSWNMFGPEVRIGFCLHTVFSFFCLVFCGCSFLFDLFSAFGWFCFYVFCWNQKFLERARDTPPKVRLNQTLWQETRSVEKIHRKLLRSPLANRVLHLRHCLKQVSIMDTWCEPKLGETFDITL